MGEHERRPRTRRQAALTLGGVALAAIAVTGASLGHAALMPLQSDDLLAFGADISVTTDPPPSSSSTTTTAPTTTTTAPVTQEPFTGTGSLDGTSSGSGTWVVSSGSFTLDGDKATGSHSGTSVATTGSAYSNVEVTASLINQQPREAGVILNASADATSYFSVVVEHPQAGRVRLNKTVAGVTSEVLLATNIGTPPSTVLRVTHVSGTYNVYVNGVLRLTYVMTAPELSMFGANTAHGIITVADSTSQFDNFSVVPYP